VIFQVQPIATVAGPAFNVRLRDGHRQRRQACGKPAPPG
jgi:hypothetical protein